MPWSTQLAKGWGLIHTGALLGQTQPYAEDFGNQVALSWSQNAVLVILNVFRDKFIYRNLIKSKDFIIVALDRDINS